MATVSDGRGGTFTHSFTVNVVTVSTPDNHHAPVSLSVPPAVATVGQLYTYSPVGIDADHDPLAWSLDNPPAGMSVNATTDVIRQTPTVDQLDSQTATLRLTNATGLSIVQAVPVDVTMTAPPLITTTGPASATVGLHYQYFFSATTTTELPLTYSILRGPVGMTIDAVSGRVAWTPTDFGSGTVRLAVTDVLGQTSLQEYTVTARPPQQVQPKPPVILTQPVLQANAGRLYSQTIVATDPQNQHITYSLANWPSGMTIDSETGVILWTPSGMGDATVTVQATNASGLSSTLRYTLTVRADLPLR